MIYNHLENLIGKTPTILLREENGNKIYMKLEMFNLGGSIKDRAALMMINDLETKGLLKAGSKIVESTSGNTGIALALIGALKGYEVAITMPSNMSKERIDLIASYGARIYLTPKEEGMDGAIKKAKELASQGYIYIDQFNNINNVYAHEKWTAKEIYEDFGDDLDYLVCGVGTAGTIMGLAKALKVTNKKLKVIAVEPEESSVLTNNKKGQHKIQGIGAGFIPPLYNKELVDEIVMINSDEAIKEARLMAHKGLLVGISSASAYLAAKKIAQNNKNKKILCIAPDGGNKYVSLGIYNDEK